MLSLLPDYADPWRLCVLGKAYAGAIPLVEMPRLTPLLASTEGEAAFALAFEIDAERRSSVRVGVKACVWLQCQRCLGNMRCDIDSDSQLVLVSGPEEAQRLGGTVEPLPVEDAKLELRSVIEDELILAVPPAPTHEADECNVKLAEVNAQDTPGAVSITGSREKPFAALANWKRGNENHD